MSILTGISTSNFSGGTAALDFPLTRPFPSAELTQVYCALQIDGR